MLDTVEVGNSLRCLSCEGHFSRSGLFAEKYAEEKTRAEEANQAAE